MGNLFGGGKTKVDTQPATQSVADAATASKANRSALFMTQGDSQGQELQPGQVKKRDTLFGN